MLTLRAVPLLKQLGGRAPNHQCRYLIPYDMQPADGGGAKTPGLTPAAPAATPAPAGAEAGSPQPSPAALQAALQAALAQVCSTLRSAHGREGMRGDGWRGPDALPRRKPNHQTLRPCASGRWWRIPCTQCTAQPLHARWARLARTVAAALD